jgi:hypothetical protein
MMHIIAMYLHKQREHSKLRVFLVPRILKVALTKHWQALFAAIPSEI